MVRHRSRTKKVCLEYALRWCNKTAIVSTVSCKSCHMKLNFSSLSFVVLMVCTAINSQAQTGVTRYGTNALANNTSSGIYNSAFGYYALFANTSGNKNTATGANVLRANTTGSYNTASGYAALYQSTTGNNNSAFGIYSMFENTTGAYNTASGGYSMRLNTSGLYNTATGYNALYSNTSGDYNTANGYEALFSSTTANYNTAVGSLSMRANTTGYANTAAGRYSLSSNTTGYYNATAGYYSMYSNTTGRYNAALGYRAMYSNTTGYYNTVVGAQANVASGALTNATAIGYNAIVDASNKVRIGNTAVVSIGGQVGWTTFSDGRYKKDVKENVPGLSFIKSLRPVTYTVNVKGLNEYYDKAVKTTAGNADDEAQPEAMSRAMEQADAAASKVLYNGFIAQEVEEAANKLNFNFSGIDKPQSKSEMYGLRYDNFVAPLVKAVQELADQNETLKSENSELRKRLDNIEAALAKNSAPGSASLIKDGATVAKLEQNAPNPFNNSTVIRYQLGASASAAQIVITNSAGSIVKQFNIAGTGQVAIRAGELAAGNYNYTLFVAGKKVDSKAMMLVK